MNSDLPVWLNNQELSSIEYWESEEKYYHDDFYERGQSNFADSADSVQRTGFYLELSRIAGVNVFVRPMKRKILAILGKQLTGEVECIERRVDA